MSRTRSDRAHRCVASSARHGRLASRHPVLLANWYVTCLRPAVALRVQEIS
jgi:hypothetical protein